jgi:hypothetical protein
MEQAGVYLPARKSGAKNGPIRGSGAWDDAMMKAHGQAERYARSLPDGHATPPFLLVADIGHTIELYADFTQAGKAYLPYPDPRTFRIRLSDLAEESVRDRLRQVWLDPLSLDPSKISAAVTREIADLLATLAASLERSGHPPKLVGEFLTRCLFCMFAEDVGLLPKDGFRGLLESLRSQPEGFVPKLRQLFSEMQTGTEYSVILNQKLLRFNGGLFEEASVLPLDAIQIEILIQAAAAQWKNVEPAIFGTLLERALDPEERHALGAHYTPRAYVERLILPTIVEPLRSTWESVRTAAVVHAQAGRMDDARKEMRQLPDIDRLLSKVHSMGIKLASDHPETRAVYYEMPIYNKRKIKDFTTALRGLGVAQHPPVWWRPQPHHAGGAFSRWPFGDHVAGLRLESVCV